MKGFPVSWVIVTLFWTLLVFSNGHPTDVYLAEHEDVQADGKALDDSSHFLKMEHKEDTPLDSVMDTLLSPEATKTVDQVASSFVKLAGGVVDHLGDFVVDTIDQLPETIRLVTDAVGKAVENKREKVVIMVKGTHLEDDVIRAKEASDRITSAVQQSQLQSNLQALEDAFASLVGKFIGATYKNADQMSSALTDGFKKITGNNEDELQILSRSNKENEISLEKSAA